MPLNKLKVISKLIIPMSLITLTASNLTHAKVNDEGQTNYNRIEINSEIHTPFNTPSEYPQEEVKLSPDLLAELNSIPTEDPEFYEQILLDKLQLRVDEQLAELERKIEEEGRRKKGEQERLLREQQNNSLGNTQNIIEPELSADVNSNGIIKSLTVEATSYDAMCDAVIIDGRDYDACSGITATGIDVRHWTPRIIAVDPDVIPLHSIVEIFVDGQSIGRYQAEDTGGDIKGNRIDILASSKNEAFSFGRKKDVVVNILNVSAIEQKEAYQELLTKSKGI